MRTIVWDVDDVLNNLMDAWFHECWLPSHSDCAVRYADLCENPPHAVLGVAKQEYLDSLDGFRASNAGRRLTPNAEIMAWMRDCGDRFRHVALTARPLQFAGSAADWLFEHFGEWIRCYGVVPSRPHPATPVYDRDKAEFLRWFQAADYFVDDSPANLETVGALGVAAIAFPQPWNSSRCSVRETLLRLEAL